MINLFRIADKITDAFECENIRRQCIEQIEVLSQLAKRLDGSSESLQEFDDQLNKVKELQEHYMQNCDVYL
jgi:hypothetical protein